MLKNGVKFSIFNIIHFQSSVFSKSSKCSFTCHHVQRCLTLTCNLEVVPLSLSLSLIACVEGWHFFGCPSFLGRDWCAEVDGKLEFGLMEPDQEKMKRNLEVGIQYHICTENAFSLKLLFCFNHYSIQTVLQ